MEDVSQEKSIQRHATTPKVGSRYNPKPSTRCLCAGILSSTILSALILVFTIVYFPVMFQNIVNSQVILKKGTLSYEQWLFPTPAIYKVVTVYNVTNPTVVEAGGKPELSPIGPYYFREYRQRVAVNVSGDGSELLFRERKWYEFDDMATNSANNSTLDPTVDIFVTLNIPYIGLAYNLTLEHASFFKVLAVTELALSLNEATLLMNRTVNEVVFGFEDPLLRDIGKLMPGVPSTVQLVYNMSHRDTFTTSKIRTGAQNISSLGQYTQWQGYSRLPYWGSDAANTVNGTEGIFFAPNLNKSETLTTFVDDLFRSNPLEFVGEEVVKTLNTYKYRIPTYVQDNATNNPLNEGFYSFCPNGLMNLTAAVQAPIFASKPSFLDAEEWLLEEVSGLPAADKATMDTNIWVEPHTGALVNAFKRLQVNIMIFKQSKFPGLKTLRDTPRYIPIAKMVETGGMDEDLLATFKHKVFWPRDLFLGGLWAVFGLLCLIALACINVFLSRKCKERRRIAGMNEEERGDEKEALIPDTTRTEVERDQNIYESI